MSMRSRGGSARHTKKSRVSSHDIVDVTSLTACIYSCLCTTMFPSPQPRDADAPIRETDNDALLARLSASQRGYLNDPFVRYFVPRAHLQQPRPPLINIGTYVRSESIDKLVDAWLKLCKLDGNQCQIISLGAGSDTRFWRLAVRRYHLCWVLCLIRSADRLASTERILQSILKLTFKK